MKVWITKNSCSCGSDNAPSAPIRHRDVVLLLPLDDAAG